MQKLTTAAGFYDYAQSAARDYLASMAHYDNTYVTVGDGKVSTPSYCENKLRKAFHMRRETALPSGAWRGEQWSKFAERILAGE
ncbi:hypothetical protein I5G81_gp95 [Mycobacterium phage Shandong1]|uniref:Uncharacterized protein n=1 Tax=Mycobacterium phage Shandong1 TaxID=1983447 RepID=A0A1X9SHI3_9CAUD|nr:hypothetical protein I5G81_gp95 [Mycobacterium phage Shandong1]ARQ95534.1 hypothetical protein [Mycobacterium phage Shandong1]